MRTMFALWPCTASGLACAGKGITGAPAIDHTTPRTPRGPSSRSIRASVGLLDICK